MPLTMNENQEKVFFEVILWNRAKLNFEPSFEEMVDLPASEQWGATINTRTYYDPRYNVMVNPSTYKALRNKAIFDGVVKDYTMHLCLNRAGMDYLLALNERLERYLVYEAEMKAHILGTLSAQKSAQERTFNTVAQQVARIDAMRETPPQVGEYLLFHNSSQEEPKVVYAEIIYPERENAHARELGSRVVHNVGWQYLERPLNLPHELHYEPSTDTLRYARPVREGIFSPHRQITLEHISKRVYLATADTLEELKLLNIMLTEFIILQERK